MKKELKIFAADVASAISKRAINNLIRKGIEIVDYQVYIDYNEEDEILHDIKLEVTITSDNPLTLSNFSYLRHTLDGKTIGVIYGKKILKLAEATAYKFPINIQQMFMRFVIFDFLNKRFNLV